MVLSTLRYFVFSVPPRFISLVQSIYSAREAPPRVLASELKNGQLAQKMGKLPKKNAQLRRSCPFSVGQAGKALRATRSRRPLTSTKNRLRRPNHHREAARSFYPDAAARCVMRPRVLTTKRSSRASRVAPALRRVVCQKVAAEWRLNRSSSSKVLSLTIWAHATVAPPVTLGRVTAMRAKLSTCSGLLRQSPEPLSRACVPIFHIGIATGVLPKVSRSANAPANAWP